MAHLSEEVLKLKIVYSIKSFSNVKAKSSDVNFIALPYYNSLVEVRDKELLYSNLNRFIEKAEEKSIIAILTSPVVGADLISSSDINKYYKLWIPIKLEFPVENENYINQSHCALLIFSKSEHALEHSKTRISYSYCPFCNKTTKDYGGKKHLHHYFGTLISDVWRDISVNFNSNLNEIIERLQDFFGVAKYENLYFYDQRKEYERYTNKKYVYKHFEYNTGPAFLPSKLINGDCIEELQKIPDNSVDFCFADPPYNIKKKYNNWNDSLDIKDYFKWCDSWLSELARILKPGRTLAVLNIPKWCIRHFKHLNTILDFQDWIVWEGLSLPNKGITPVHYSILCFSKGRPRPLPGKNVLKNAEIDNQYLYTSIENFCLRNSCIKQRKIALVNDKEPISNLWWDIHRLMQNSLREDHPCQLPPSFMYRLISLFTYENEMVLDPFNGVGTTTLCSDILQRKYIGIELSEYYHLIASERHNEIKLDLDPFRSKNSNLPKVKNSYVERVQKRKYKVSKKTLQLEVKSIAEKLGRLPTKKEVFAISNYPSEYYEEYFLKWSEIYAAAKTTGMSELKTPTENITTTY